MPALFVIPLELMIGLDAEPMGLAEILINPLAIT